MKQIIFILLAILLFGRCTNNQAQQSAVSYANLEAGKFKEMAEGSNGIILDVRTPEEVNSGYITGASTIDFYDKEFSEKIAFIDREKSIFVYCKSGGRSSQAADLLIQKGFKTVYNLEGGIMSWESNGFAVIKPENTADDKIQQLSVSDFNQILNSDKPVLVDFHTKWCVPCKKMAPIIDAVAEEYKERAVVLRVDIDKSKDLAKAYQVQGIPVFILFKNKDQKWKHNGIVNGEKIREELNKVIP